MTRACKYIIIYHHISSYIIIHAYIYIWIYLNRYLYNFLYIYIYFIYVSLSSWLNLTATGSKNLGLSRTQKLGSDCNMFCNTFDDYYWLIEIKTCNFMKLYLFRIPDIPGWSSGNLHQLLPLYLPYILTFLQPLT